MRYVYAGWRNELISDLYYIQLKNDMGLSKSYLLVNGIGGMDSELGERDPAAMERNSLVFVGSTLDLLMVKHVGINCIKSDGQVSTHKTFTS